MVTERLPTRDALTAESTIAQASTLLREGDLVALPTETVYGVAARADRPDALRRLRELKGRDGAKPFTYVFPDRAAALAAAARISASAQRLADRFWPGPLTLVLDSPDGGSVGVRVPGNEVTLEILRRVGAPVALPSANPAGDAPAADADAVLSYFTGQIAAVVDDGKAPLGVASTVVDARGPTPEVLREGILTRDQIRRAAALGILFVCSGNTCRSPMAETLSRALLAARLGVTTDDLADSGFRIASAGMFAGAGQPASEGALAAMEARSLDLTQHRSRPLTAELLVESDCVFAMTQSLVERLRAISPTPDRIQHIDPRGRDVVDPFGGSNAVYEQCATEIEERLRVILDAIAG